MFIGGPVILSAVFLIQAEMQFEASTRLETRVGEVPNAGLKQVTTTDTSGNTSTTTETSDQTQVMVILTPIFDLRLLNAVDDLRASSTTRILWRPVPRYDERPLFLETLESTYTRRINRRIRWRFNGSGTFGEEDYTSLAQQFANSPALPTATTWLMLNAASEASWRSSRRSTLTLQLSAIHRRPFDDQQGTENSEGTTSAYGQNLTTTSASIAPGVAYNLSRRSILDGSLVFADTDIQGYTDTTFTGKRFNVFSIQPQLQLRDKLNRQHELQVAAGLTYALAIRRPDTTRAWQPLAPLLQIDLTSQLQHNRSRIVVSSLGAASSWFADPVLGVAVTRGLARASLETQFGRNWSVGAQVAFSTDLSERLPEIDGYLPDETFFSLDIPVRYRWTSQLFAEFGARYSERAPHLGSADFAWRNREVWLFLTLFTTARPSPVRT